jgi:tetratricopeptide (TPR) repeat protein
MAQKGSRRVKTLSGFMRWAEQFNDGRYLFRGVSKHTYKMEASAYRRLPEVDRNNPARLLKINRELIDKARLLGHDQKDGHYLSDLELLAELQHFGAATCLIDFTRSAQIALWFACQQSSSGEANGKVFAVRSDDPVLFRAITPKLVAEENIEYFFKEDERGSCPLYQWQPKQWNNRVIAQQSVFIFGGAEIVEAAECVILKSSKSEILDSLDSSASITEASIYPDFDGFARLHAQNKRHIQPDIQGYLQRGIMAQMENKLDEAITYYSEVISLQPDASTLTIVYQGRGFAYFLKREFAPAIGDFTKAMEYNPNDAITYYSRGTAYSLAREFDLAIKDYTKAIELKPEFSEVYVHRGAAYVDNNEVDLALKDFSEAIELKPGDPATYVRRGIAYGGKGKLTQLLKILARQ